MRVAALPLSKERRATARRRVPASRAFFQLRAIEILSVRVRSAMEDYIKKLVEQLLKTEDLRIAQSLAVELQWAVYRHIEQLQRRLSGGQHRAPNNPRDQDIL